jgi:excinuclease UvrABC nuclease subunit
MTKIRLADLVLIDGGQGQLKAAQGNVGLAK